MASGGAVGTEACTLALLCCEWLQDPGLLHGVLMRGCGCGLFTSALPAGGVLLSDQVYAAMAVGVEGEGLQGGWRMGGGK